MSEMTQEYVSGRAFDEVSDMYEVTLKQLEAAKADAEFISKRHHKDVTDLLSQLAAEKAKSAKMREALHKLQVGCHPDSECRAIVDEALAAEVQG